MAMRTLLVLSVAGLATFALPSQSVFAQERASNLLHAASEVVENFGEFASKEVPPALLHDAQAVAIIPGVGKTGFVISSHYGQGVILTRNGDGSWNNPMFVSLVGGNAGLHFTRESTDIIVIFRTGEGVEYLMRKGKVILGRNAKVGTGPLVSQAGTDPKLPADAYCYARSNGAFAGVSLASTGLRGSGGVDPAALKKDPQPVDRLKADLKALCGPSKVKQVGHVESAPENAPAKPKK
jgi:lipid-binding SYLF domain-containing protein